VGENIGTGELQELAHAQINGNENLFYKLLSFLFLQHSKYYKVH